jgi:hypothetical protein
MEHLISEEILQPLDFQTQNSASTVLRGNSLGQLRKELLGVLCWNYVISGLSCYEGVWCQRPFPPWPSQFGENPHTCNGQ